MRRSAVLTTVVLLLAACGGAAKKATPPATRPAASTAAPPATTTVAPGASPLQAEANSAAAGDIPDNQVFLRFANPAAGYSIKYPEGWAQSGTGTRVTFRDKNNIVRIVVLRAARPTPAHVARELAVLGGAQVRQAPRPLTLPGASAVKATYATQSAPNAVTGKRVTLVVDRYYLWRGGKEAIVDLATPVGVDNVDAYRLMIESFRWS